MEDVIVSVKDNLLTVNLISDGNIDLDELNVYYFTDKIFKAVAAFSNKLDLEHSIQLDGVEYIR